MMVMVVRTTKGGDIFDIAWELAHKGLYIKDIEGYEVAAHKKTGAAISAAPVLFFAQSFSAASNTR